MKATVHLDPAELEQLAYELRRYAQHLRDSEAVITERLSEEAAKVASSLYSGEVTVEPTARGVTATGPGVVFEEFGAGARISDPFPGGAGVSFEIRRGAYSDLNEGEYQATGYEYWHHDGELYRYVTPRNALFYAKEHVKEIAPQIVREVLNGD